MPKHETLKRSHKRPSQILLAKAKAYRLRPGAALQVYQKIFIALDTPVSLSCYLLLKYQEFDQLATKDVDPRQYIDTDRLRDDLQAISLLRKSASLKTSFNLRDKALETFRAGEETCKSTNNRIRSYLLTGQINPVSEWLISSAIRKISRILGDFSVDELLDSCRWGPGVSQSVKGSDTSSSKKFDHEREITRDAYSLFGSVFTEAYPSWRAFLDPVFKVGNNILTVPKNAKTDRTIAVEPGLNIWIQRGLGRMIRKRLRLAGYNLNSDLKNQRGAYIGSLDGSLSTLDFKAASDSISIEVVRLLLPPQWFTVLDAARSKYYTLEGDHHWSEKFSTMGNGFTFELESLIFLALGLAVTAKQESDDKGVSIFGDDLILPTECVPEYTEVCSFLGFKLNVEKTFVDSPFRESCGSYFFNGIDVKPIFIKKDPIYVKDVFRLANALRRLSHSHLTGSCDLRFRSVWSFLIHQLPESLRLFGPLASGDATIHENHDSRFARRHPEGWEGFTFPGFIEVPLTIEKDSLGLLLARLYTTSEDEMGNLVFLRARTRLAYKKAMFVHLWYDFGHWV